MDGNETERESDWDYGLFGLFYSAAKKLLIINRAREAGIFVRYSDADAHRRVHAASSVRPPCVAQVRPVCVHR